ncbi:MAG TPA: peptidylprolyl isomerase [Candidatus Binatia bacterium]|jgi:hypothetical protein|nr:peptidylprolyl isomerase [Candidatus Binatia bacterium]
MRWLHTPLLHFLAGGAVLFVVVHGRGTPPTVAPSVDTIGAVVLTAHDVDRLRTDYERETGLAPTPADEVRLVDQAIDEELLVREARARGLDRNDRSIRTWLTTQMATLSDGAERTPDALLDDARALGLDRSDVVVRRILVQKMRLLAARTDDASPSDDTLRAYYDHHRDDYRAPERVSFWHVFFASTRGDARREATALRASFERQPVAPETAARQGDAFPLPPWIAAQSPRQLEKFFGAAFTAELGRVAPRTWVGPLTSPYGVHLVWVASRDAGGAPPFEAVRGRVVERWKDERRRERVVELLRDLKRRHPLEVESAAWQQRSAS